MSRRPYRALPCPPVVGGAGPLPAAMACFRDMLSRLTPRQYALAAAAVIALSAVALSAMGHVTICKCGYVKLWHGVPLSSENSQHISDWYTFSHIIHGFAFYGLLRLVARRWPLGLRLVAAIGLEAA